MSRLIQYTQFESPFFNKRPSADVSLLVIHNISLPAGHFSTPFVHDLFMGCLDCTAHESFDDLREVEVSSHFFINREGRVSQFVAMDKRAWHAGTSYYNGRENCNDFSIGIELEGTDVDAYTDGQYQALVSLTHEIMEQYPLIKPENIVGHCDISPGRKTDPGAAFNWKKYRLALEAL